MINDRHHVADQLAELRGRLDGLAAWIASPSKPFPVDAYELGQFTGRVAVLLMVLGSAPGDGSQVGRSEP